MVGGLWSYWPLWTQQVTAARAIALLLGLHRAGRREQIVCSLPVLRVPKVHAR